MNAQTNREANNRSGSGALALTLLAALPAFFACAPPQDGAPGEADTPAFFEMEVFFATDRAPDEDPSLGFTGDRGEGDLTFGQATVSIPNSHEIGELEGPQWWRRWDRDDPTEFVVVLSVEQFAGASEFANSVSTVLADAESDEVLIFVHGYNTEFEDAARRTAQLAYDLQFPGAALLYSWPSKGEEGGYPADEASVEWTLPHFENFLRLAMTDLGAGRVHVIAHSMGNRPLIRALAQFDPQSLPPDAAELRQIVLAAPDIDVGVFRQLAVNFPGKAARITLYASERDKAIRLSRTFHAYQRAGGHVVIVDGVETIDASEAETSFVAHTYFGASILGDLHGVVRLELPPGKRFGLNELTTAEGSYWKLLPGAFRR